MFICDICGKTETDEDMTKLSLYFDGSSTMKICWSCRLGLIEIIKQMRSVASRARLEVAHAKR